MCNLYSLTKGQKAIRDLAKAMVDSTGNLWPQPSIFPDGMAPIVSMRHDGKRELLKARRQKVRLCYQHAHGNDTADLEDAEAP